MSPKSKEALSRFILAADRYAFGGKHSGTPEWSYIIKEYDESLRDLKAQLR